MPDYWRFQEKVTSFEQKKKKSVFIFVEKYTNQL